jgi:hypothetical protein
VPRYLPHASRTTLLICLLVFVLSVAGAMARGQADASAETLLGRLAIVEPASRRITVLPEGEVHLVEVFLDENGEVRLAERELTLAELVIEVGRRVTVRYRVEKDRRIAERVIVEPER